MLSLATSWGTQAAVESVPPTNNIWFSSWLTEPACAITYYSSFEGALQGTLSCACRTSNAHNCTLVSASLQSQDSNYISYAIDFSIVSANGFQDIGGEMIFGEVTCPEPTINPTVPYKYNITTNMCERRASFTITLLAGLEIEPSNDSTTYTLPIIATVKDQSGQAPNPGVTVHVSLKVDSKSGGHDHGDSTRPRGGIAELDTCPSDDVCWPSPQSIDGKGMTDGNGQVVFNFNPPDASGIHTISATCDKCTNTATANINVMVDGLWPISASTYYALTEDGSSKVIGSTTEHSSNHYISSEAQQKLWTLAMDFYNYQLLNGASKPTLLHLNDASLKWGGLFDKDGDWVPEHKEHRRGSVIDVRANSTAGAIPPELFKKYIEMATKLGIDPHLEYIGDPLNQHFHTRLLNRKE